MIKIKINTNTPAIKAQFRRVTRDQLPFASALALTNVAAAGMRDARTELTRDLTIRNAFSARGIQTNRAEKRDWPLQKASVGIEEHRGYLVDQVLGGERRPSKSPFKGVPQTDVVPRGSSGRMPSSRRPKALLAKLGKKSRGVGYFLVSQPSRELLFQTKRGSAPKLAYAFTRVVKIKPRFSFEQAVEQSVKANYVRELTKAFDRAITTSK